MNITTNSKEIICGKNSAGVPVRRRAVPGALFSFRRMTRTALTALRGARWLALLAVVGAATAQVADNLVVEGVPPIPSELKASVSRHLEFRSASFQSWHPTRREMLISTRFADSAQFFLVRQPLGQRKQLTF